MQEYKREHLRAQEQIAQLNEKQIDYEAHLSTVDLYWNKVCWDFQFASIQPYRSIYFVDIDTDEPFTTYL